jgi:hypothetical protein
MSSHLWLQLSYKTMFQSVGFEILTAVVMKSAIFWDITPYNPLKVSQRLGGTYRLHLQGRRITEKETGVKAGGKQLCAACQAGFLLGLFFDTEDGGDMFLLNVG